MKEVVRKVKKSNLNCHSSRYEDISELVNTSTRITSAQILRVDAVDAKNNFALLFSGRLPQKIKIVTAGANNKNGRSTLKLTKIIIYGTPPIELMNSEAIPNVLYKDFPDKLPIVPKEIRKRINVASGVESQVVEVLKDVPVSFGDLLVSVDFAFVEGFLLK